MTITICGSLKFYDNMLLLKAKLEKLGHTAHLPVMLPDIDYWAEDSAARVQAKQGKDLISEHIRKIEQSDAVLIANFSKPDMPNYIGANTFLEIGVAHYLGKKIFVLNPLPNQPYITEELQAIRPTIINGDLRVLHV